jgi:hypothetical protein
MKRAAALDAQYEAASKRRVPPPAYPRLPPRSQKEQAAKEKSQWHHS